MRAWRDYFPNSESSIGIADSDLVADDGLHRFHGGRCLFEHSFDMVRPGGLQFIEDVAMTCTNQAVFHRARRTGRLYELNAPENGLQDNSLIAIGSRATIRSVRRCRLEGMLTSCFASEGLRHLVGRSASARLYGRLLPLRGAPAGLDLGLMVDPRTTRTSAGSLLPMA